MKGLFIMRKRKLAKIIKKHQKWLNGERGGKCANFKKKNLKNADFSNIDLSYANFEGAKLFGANFKNSKLHHANFIKAKANEVDFTETDLTFADFYGASLVNSNFINACAKVALFNYANLYNTNFTYAQLEGANFKESNLNKAVLDKISTNNNTKYLTVQCPINGSFVGYKKLAGGYIAKLKIPKSALRTSAASNMCRCDKAEVLSITKKNGKNSKKTTVKSIHDKNFIYQVGKIVKVKGYDKNRWNQNSPGIHFFMTRQEAVDW